MPMPKPGEKETQDAYVSRFMADEAMLSEYPDQKQRAAVAYAQWRGAEKNATAKNALGMPGNVMLQTWPKRVRIWHLEPGLVRYEYLNRGQGKTVLVTKAFMDQMRPTLMGKPIFNERHRDISAEEARRLYAEGKAQGVIFEVGWDAGRGWDYADAFVWDEDTVANIDRGYSASCQYEVTNMGDGGLYHNIPYDAVALDGAYEHIAIVPEGRYEGVQILMNSKPQGGSTMKISIWPFNKESKETAKNAVEIDSDKATLEVDGKPVPLADAVAAYQEQERARNAAPSTLADTDMVTIGDKKVSGAELKAAFALKAKNESDTKAEAEMKKAHDDGEHDGKDLKNCPMCNKAKNEHDEKEEAKKKGEEAEEKAKNAAAQARADKEAKELERLANERREPLPFVEPQSLQERAEKGKTLFGSAKAA